MLYFENFVVVLEKKYLSMMDIIQSREVLYITERSSWGEEGEKLAVSAFGSVQAIYWSTDMPRPDLSAWEGDWIVSFKSDLVLPLSVINRAKKGVINFHPCPPKYRGLGGYWWALHNGDHTFGVTCHHMNERIDHGDIIKTIKFPILLEETVDSLKRRAAIHSLDLLRGILGDIIAGKLLLPSGEKWHQHLYTQRELEMAQAEAALSSAQNRNSFGNETRHSLCCG